jgi:PTS system mannitol-specific IIC component
MTPKGNYLGVLAGVAISTAVSFLVASYFVKRSSDKVSEEDLSGAKEKVKEMKYKPQDNTASNGALTNVNKIVFACDAGMGSSAMGATTLKNKLKKAGLDIEVMHCAIEEIPSDAKVIITHKSLTERARAKAPNAYHVSIDNFINSPEYDKLVDRLLGK